MKKLLLLFTLFSITCLFSEPIWQNLRFSAETPEAEVLLRTEIPLLEQNSLLFRTAEGLQTAEFSHWQAETWQAALPSAVSEFGLRSAWETPEIDVVSVWLQALPLAEAAQPVSSELNWIVDDPVADSAVEEDFLDLLGTYISYDDERLYFGLRNNGGGFPVSAAPWGPFYSYLSLIIPPDLLQTPFGLLYTVDQPGVIAPGLYKLNGTELEDLELVGEIELYQDAANDLLVMSCAWSDLLAQPEFAAWWDAENPLFNTASGTARITLAGGMEEGDYTSLGSIIPQSFEFELPTNTLPQISDFSYDEAGYLSFSYNDAEANFAISATAVFDDGSELLLYPQTYDFSGEVTYRSAEPAEQIVSGNWQTISLLVTDNSADYVEAELAQNGVEVAVLENDIFQVGNYPNPFNPSTTIYFSLAESAFVELDVYNAKGQLVRTLAAQDFAAGQHSLVWNGTDAAGQDVTSGVYYYRIQTAAGQQSQRMLLLK